MRIALAQLNPIVGDVAGNAALVIDAIDQARRERADLLVTSELALIGYPPRDLLLRQGVVESCEEAVRCIADHARGLHVLVGHPAKDDSGVRPLRNRVTLCGAGKVIATADKQLLPGYDVFDEDRYFEPGARSLVVPMAGKRVGVLICEDLWRAEDVETETRYRTQPIVECMKQGCDLIVSLNASPFVIGKWRRHVQQLTRTARELNVPIVAVNQVGANDDLIFDGRSLAVRADGSIAAALAGFESAVWTFDLSRDTSDEPNMTSWEEQREVYAALVLGIRDYVRKTGHREAIVGLSGGIDSALVAVLAAAALGSQHVHGVMMPSMYSSPGSISDARDLAERLRLASCREIAIHQMHEAARLSLAPALREECAGVADENVQARLRGITLMALSNASGALVLSTSNKSEIATGYSTLYGDMCGALAPLGDLVKRRIYSLARWINANPSACGFAKPPIPENSITKPPSAELRPNQTDQDTLPPYDVLDEIVERFIEHEQSAETIIAETGFDGSLVRDVVKMIDRAQYKRDQAAVILKVTGRAFGRGRPMPIVMKTSRSPGAQKCKEGSARAIRDPAQ